MDDFKQLRHLIALNDYRTVREAAESVGVTRSALSQSLRRIEDVYGVRLFERNRRGVSTTHYGSVLVDAAKRGLDIFSQAERELSLLRNLETGRLMIGCDPIVSEILLAPLLSRIMSLFPHLQFTVKSGFWDDQEEGLRSGNTDIYIGILPDDKLSEFSVIPFTLPGMYVFCRAGHPLTERPDIAMSEIYDYPIVGTWMPDWFYYGVNGAGRLHAHGTRNKDLFLLANDASTIRNIVKHSDGVSGGFRGVMIDDVRAGSLVVLPLDQQPVATPVPCVAVTKRERMLPPVALQVIDMMRAVAAEQIVLDESFAARSVSRANQ